MYVYVYVYTFIYVYIYVCVYIHIIICIHNMRIFVRGEHDQPLFVRGEHDQPLQSGPQSHKKKENITKVQESKSRIPRAYTGRRSRMQVPAKRWPNNRISVRWDRCEEQRTPRVSNQPSSCRSHSGTTSLLENSVSHRMARIPQKKTAIWARKPHVSIRTLKTGRLQHVHHRNSPRA